jgi:hypothetical protein
MEGVSIQTPLVAFRVKSRFTSMPFHEWFSCRTDRDLINTHLVASFSDVDVAIFPSLRGPELDVDGHRVSGDTFHVSGSHWSDTHLRALRVLPVTDLDLEPLVPIAWAPEHDAGTPGYILIHTAGFALCLLSSLQYPRHGYHHRRRGGLYYTREL